MKLEIGGEEVIPASANALWAALNDPAVLTRALPGCRGMTETAPDACRVEMQLRVGAVSGSFEGAIALRDKEAPSRCRITVSGSGTLGHGQGEARFEISARPDGQSLLTYSGSGEIGGLVAGVGQRVLGGVAKHLIGRFFTALRKEFVAPSTEAAQ